MSQASSRRRSVYVEGQSHSGQPIPNACCIGPVLWSGGIGGLDGDGVRPADLGEEVVQMFNNLEAVLTAGGASLDDVIRLTVAAVDRAGCRKALNACWEARFPDPASRPARHLTEAALPGGMRVQCEVVAITGEVR